MTEVYSRADWYRSRPEPETVWRGTLEEGDAAVGPGMRGGLSYVLIADQSRLKVYAANVENILAPFLGRLVKARGKLVNLRGDGDGEELWIASIETNDG
jgi:hypothetical protein